MEKEWCADTMPSPAQKTISRTTAHFFAPGVFRTFIIPFQRWNWLE
jgi:hypothetical protein